MTTPYRQFLIEQRLLVPAGLVTRCAWREPCLRLTEGDRDIAREHVRAGEHGNVEMALPRDQVPEFIQQYFGWDRLQEAA